MKKIFSSQTYISIFSVLTLCVIINLISFAQDNAASSGSSSQTTTSVQHFTTVQPWVWIVGGVILLVVIIAVVAGSRNKKIVQTDKTTYTKTISRDNM
jgi:hypothetical protein